MISAATTPIRGIRDRLRRQHTGQRVQIDPGHAHGLSHQTGVLSARATKGIQHIITDIITTLHRNLASRSSHVINSYRQKCLSQLLRLPIESRCLTHFTGKL